MMASDIEFEAFADEAVASWGRCGAEYGYQELEAAIATLYGSRLEFPCAWTESQRNEFIEDRASRDADEMATSFDDLADTVAESLRWHCHLHGYGLHSEDISAHVDLARRSKIDDLRWCMVDEIPDEIRRVDRELAEELADEMQRVGQGK